MPTTSGINATRSQVSRIGILNGIEIALGFQQTMVQEGKQSGGNLMQLPVNVFCQLT
jgi:hypothetical protein